jgi:hypothetical protein
VTIGGYRQLNGDTWGGSLARPGGWHLRRRLNAGASQLVRHALRRRVSGLGISCASGIVAVAPSRVFFSLMVMPGEHATAFRHRKPS